MILLDYDANINNNPSYVKSALSLILDVFTGVIKTLQSIKLFANVSLFDFLIALTVMTIVITYLVNVAKRPTVESTTQEQARERRQEWQAYIRSRRGR